MARLKVEALAHRHRARGRPRGGPRRGTRPRAARPGLARAGPRPARRRGRRDGSLGEPLPAPARRWRPAARPSPGAAAAARGWPSWPTPSPASSSPPWARRPCGCSRRAARACEVVDPGCCGRPLLSQGLVGAARRRARRALDRLAPHALAGTADRRPRAVVLVDARRRPARAWCRDDPRARWVAERGRAPSSGRCGELGLPGLRPPATRPWCTSTATPGRSAAGARAPRALPGVPGARARDSGAGCCGMAGSFGYRHPELSRRIAEDRLVPAARGADVAVAAGTSCREPRSGA